MEFPWSVVAVIFSAITLIVLLGYNIPKFLKYISAPRIDVDIWVYPEEQCKQQGIIQKHEGMMFDKKIEVLSEVSPQLVIRIKPKWSYKITVIEVLGHSQSTIKGIDLFAKKRYWLEKKYTDIQGNYKISPDVTIKKGHTMDPLVVDFQIDPPLKRGEQRKVTIRVSTEESRKEFRKEFLVISPS